MKNPVAPSEVNQTSSFDQAHAHHRITCNMNVYRISAQKEAGERLAARKRTGFIIAISIMLGFFMGGRWIFQGQDFRLVAIWITSAGLIMAFAVWRGLVRTQRFLNQAYSSFQITDDGTTIMKVQADTPQVSLARTEIKRIQEFQGKGFRICSAARDHNIWVPCEVENYERFRTDISAIPGVEFTSQSHAWLKAYGLLAAFFAVFAVSALASDRRVVIGTSVLLSGYLGYIFIKHFRNPNLTRRAKRQILVGLFVAVCFLLRAVVIWRS